MAPAVTEIAKTLKGALEAMHLVGVCHCDVKPANVFVDSYGAVFLGDYGSAVIVDKLQCKQDALTTPEYTPREVLSREPTLWLDYALLAATLADLLCLHTPGKVALSLYDKSIKLPKDEVFLSIWNKAREGFPPRKSGSSVVPGERTSSSKASEQELGSVFD
jgi:serine/threonine protein kinase